MQLTNETIQILLSKQTTNFESLINNIVNNSDIYNLVEKIIFKGEEIKFSLKNSTIEDSVIYGILREENKYCKVHNRIYQQAIYEMFESKYETNNGKTISNDIIKQKYIVELKLFYGQEYHKQGLAQLNGYLDRENIKKGYIMLFDKKKTKKFKSGWLKFEDKDIFELWF